MSGRDDLCNMLLYHLSPCLWLQIKASLLTLVIRNKGIFFEYLYHYAGIPGEH